MNTQQKVAVITVASQGISARIVKAFIEGGFNVMANWEYWGKGYFNAKAVSIPVAVSVFPDELYPAPRSWAEQAYLKLVNYKRHEKGVNFAAWEQPKLLSEDVRAGFRSLR